MEIKEVKINMGVQYVVITNLMSNKQEQDKF